MGLGNLVDEKSEEQGAGSPVTKRYGEHEYNDRLWEWYQELNERFPIDVELEFIEVSPQLESNAAKLYTKRQDGELYQYIRVKEGILEDEDWYIRQNMLYLVVSAYFNQIGYPKVGPANDEFKWVCGRVGAATNPINMTEDLWVEGCTPFLEEDGWLCEYVGVPIDLKDDDNVTVVSGDGSVEPPEE